MLNTSSFKIYMYHFIVNASNAMIRNSYFRPIRPEFKCQTTKFILIFYDLNTGPPGLRPLFIIRHTPYFILHSSYFTINIIQCTTPFKDHISCFIVHTVHYKNHNSLFIAHIQRETNLKPQNSNFVLPLSYFTLHSPSSLTM